MINQSVYWYTIFFRRKTGALGSRLSIACCLLDLIYRHSSTSISETAYIRIRILFSRPNEQENNQKASPPNLLFRQILFLDVIE